MFYHWIGWQLESIYHKEYPYDTVWYAWQIASKGIAKSL